MKKYINFQLIFEMILLFGYSVFFIFKLIDGSINAYVHPRNIPFVVFAAVIMFIISCLLLYKLLLNNFRKNNSKFNYSLIIYLIPLLMGFIFKPAYFDASTKSVNKINLDSDLKTTLETTTTTNTITANEQIDTTQYTQVNETKETDIKIENGVIIIDSYNFYNALNKIYVEIDNYMDKPIEVVAFVYKDEEQFSDTQFVPARMLMSCCAADMVPVGLVCNYDKTSELVENSWVKVEGRLGVVDYNGKSMPCINADKITKTDKPAQEYIYP